MSNIITFKIPEDIPEDSNVFLGCSVENPPPDLNFLACIDVMEITDSEGNTHIITQEELKEMFKDSVRVPPKFRFK
tara:strand:+ start:26 stop:253 length:228 start_codon:yes stop_codon:yes gene_type:complete